MTLKTIIRLLYVYQFCLSTVFILPVIVPYYQNQLGVDFKTLMIGEALFAAVIIAMEVPSGYLSDRWSRKGTLMLGILANMIGYTGLIFADAIWQIFAAQAIIGVGVAFFSGTSSALLYDHLAARDKTHLFQKLEGKRHGMGLYAVAFGAVIGGLAYSYNPYLPLILDVVTLAIAFMVIAAIPEPTRIKRAAEGNVLKDIAITMKYALHGHKEIAGIILVSMILFSSTKMFMWIQQPYMQMVDIPTYMFGFIMAAGFLMGGMAGHFGHKIKHDLGNRHMMMILVGYCVVMALLAAFIAMPFAVLFILLISPIWGFGFPFVQNAINKHADPARRATILSTLGLCTHLMFIPASFGLGWINDEISTSAALMFLPGYLTLLTPIGFYLWRKGTLSHTDDSSKFIIE
jgi:MFS family permease